MKDSDKVVRIKGRKPTLDDELLNIAKVLTDDAALAPKDVNEQPHTSYQVTGNNNVLGDGNFINSGTIHITPLTKQPRPKVYVQTGVGVLDSHQKKLLTDLVYELRNTYNALKKREMSYGAAWKVLTNPLGVSSYHEIKMTDFDRAKKILQAEIGRLRNMNSAPKKLDDWRPKQIQSIQARCNKNGWQEWRKAYMLKTFSKSSMKELTDKELKQLYRAVWNKK